MDFPAALEPVEPLTPPAISAPAPREIAFGEVRGRVGPGTIRIVVTVNGARRAETAVIGTRFRVAVPLPPRDVTIRVIAFDLYGRRAVSHPVGPVFGLPAAAVPRGTRSIEDPGLSRVVRNLTREFPGIGAFYVQNLRTGKGAAWNAGARFPAASTLKLAIAVEVLRTLRGRVAPGSRVDSLLRKMLIYSDNHAANELEVWLGGSISAGAARVNGTMRALGLRDSHIFGGYEVETAAARPIPVTVESQPSFGLGKYTTAWDLARLHRYVHLAAGGRGRLLRLPGSFTPADARFALFVLARVRDPGKLDRFLRRPAAVVLHKAGWITYARHDAGLVYWKGGGFVAAVMTWNGAGVGIASDVLAGRVARESLRRFSSTAVSGARTTATRRFTT
ncbi:MAG: serine hydrolase [Gaiellales bacterium]